MTRHEQERVKRHLDIVGVPLLAMVKDEGTMDQRIGLLIALYMHEIRKVEWSTLCIDAHIWDEIKREMQYNREVYYRTQGFGGDALVHNINALHTLFEASKEDRKAFKGAYLMFKLSLV